MTSYETPAKCRAILVCLEPHRGLGQCSEPAERDCLCWLHLQAQQAVRDGIRRIPLEVRQ